MGLFRYWVDHHAEQVNGGSSAVDAKWLLQLGPCMALKGFA
jgi:hypothetical protein